MVFKDVDYTMVCCAGVGDGQRWSMKIEDFQSAMGRWTAFHIIRFEIQEMYSGQSRTDERL